MKRIAQMEILKTQMDIKKELDSRTKNMRDFVNTQVKQSQLSFENFKDEVQMQ